jgi:hypothetical protein
MKSLTIKNVMEVEKGKNEENQEQQPATKRAPRIANLIITEVTYKLREHGPGDERPQRTWLDALYVCFLLHSSTNVKEPQTGNRSHAQKYGQKADLNPSPRHPRQLHLPPRPKETIHNWLAKCLPRP